MRECSQTGLTSRFLDVGHLKRRENMNVCAKVWQDGGESKWEGQRGTRF